MKKYLVILAAVLGFSSAAHAGLYLEPYVGYFSGKFTMDSTPPLDEKGSGPMFGGKIGFSQMGFAGGADFMTGTLTAKTTPEEKIKPTALGVFVQFSLPMLMKFSGTYFVSGKAAGDDFDLTSGSGMKVGVGLTMLPFVSINLDYMDLKYKKFESSGFEVDLDSGFKGMMLGVSVPFDL